MKRVGGMDLWLAMTASQGFDLAGWPCHAYHYLLLYMVLEAEWIEVR